MKGDFIDIISNRPYEMHNSLSDEDYSKIIYDLKDNHKELIYFLYLRDFTTNQLDAINTLIFYTLFLIHKVPYNHLLLVYINFTQKEISNTKILTQFFLNDNINLEYKEDI